MHNVYQLTCERMKIMKILMMLIILMLPTLTNIRYYSGADCSDLDSIALSQHICLVLLKVIPQ